MAKVETSVVDLNKVANAFNVEAKFGKKNAKIETEKFTISGVIQDKEKGLVNVDWITTTHKTVVDFKYISKTIQSANENKDITKRLNKINSNIWLVDIPNEVQESLENITTDDKIKMEDISIEYALKEAKYVLSTFDESGHANGEALESDDSEEKKRAQQEKQAIEQYISKLQQYMKKEGIQLEEA